MPSHNFHFGALKPQVLKEGGSRTDVRHDQFPSLNRFSLSLLTLDPKGVREPHWHSNARELSYCLEGKGRVTIVETFGSHESFTIEAGDAFFVPVGFLHHIENDGDIPLKLLISFDNENAENNEMSTAFQNFPPEVLAAVFKQSASFFTPLQKVKEPVVISRQEKPISSSFQTIDSRYKYNVGASEPQIDNLGGWVKMLNKTQLPFLDGLAVYLLQLNEKGIREPHWHPNANELNYCVSGQVRIDLEFPGGTVESFTLSPGDISILPQGYIHHIENIGPEPAFLVVFFNNESPYDIGLSAAAGAYSNEVLASLFNITNNYFETFPKYQKNLMIVPGSK